MIVRAVEKALQNDESVADFYCFLLRRELAPDFDTMTLNTSLRGAELMRRLQADHVPATTQRRAEHLGREEATAAPIGWSDYSLSA